MPIPIMLEQGVCFVGLIMVALARPRARRSSAVQPPLVCDEVAAEDHAETPLDRLPDSSSLAGVPLRILLSDHSGAGALLRDTLMTRPSDYEP